MKPNTFLAILSLIATQALVFSACGEEREPAQEVARHDTPLTLSLSLTCEACPARVKGALQKVPGVKVIGYDMGKDGKLFLAYDAKKTNPEAIKKVLADIGKPAK